MSGNAAVAATWSEFLQDLGGVPASRVLREPSPGRATFEDLVRSQESGTLCELVDGTLVEKAMGWQESLIAMCLGSLLRSFVVARSLGVVTGPDGFVRLFSDLVRAPDVAYFSWQRLPGGRLPPEPVPAIVPDLAVEVISSNNTRSEMARKCREYFWAGVSRVWMVDPSARTIAVYTSVTDYRIFGEGEVVVGGDVLPELRVPLAEVFGELDRQSAGPES